MGPPLESEEDLQKLAQATLRSMSQLVPEADSRTPKEGAQSDDEGDDLETEDEIVAKALAEAELDQAKNHHVTEDDDEEQLAASSPHDTGFSFPSLPSHEPGLGAQDTELDPDAKARMDLLLGLSGPKAKPGASATFPKPPTEIKREAGQGWNLKGYNDARDADLDSWCCECVTAIGPESSADNRYLQQRRRAAMPWV